MSRWSPNGNHESEVFSLSALEERIALEDDYFIKRKLYPNVDFYSGIICQAMGFKPEMFTVLFAIPRTVGWLAQWQEMLADPQQKIARPRQIYTDTMCASSCRRKSVLRSRPRSIRRDKPLCRNTRIRDKPSTS